MRLVFCPHCGCEHEVLGERSPPHHKMFFAFIGYCFQAWPESLEFKPDNVRHLRQWAMLSTGHTEIPFTWIFKNKREMNVVMPFVMAKVAHDRRIGVYSIARAANGGIEVVSPASLNWESMSQKKFKEVSADIIQFIYEYTGIDFNKWKDMQAPKRLRNAA